MFCVNATIDRLVWTAEHADAVEIAHFQRMSGLLSRFGEAQVFAAVAIIVAALLTVFLSWPRRAPSAKALDMSDPPSTSESDLGDGLGDWRIRVITRLAKDLPDRGPGRRAKKAGAVVQVIRSMRAQTGDEFSFPDFSSVALALSVAISADARAQELRSNVEPVEYNTETGTHRTIPHENLSPFYDFIEQCMVAATFSFQALEAFCNLTIQDALGDAGQYTFSQEICRQLPGTKVNAGDLEKKCSTEDKLSVVVPELLGVDTPKGKTPWLGYKRLQRIRNDILHLKQEDQRRGTTWPDYIDEASVFAKLVAGEISELPKTAVSLLDYFTKANGSPRWLLYPLKVYGIVPTASKPGTGSISVAPLR